MTKNSLPLPNLYERLLDCGLTDVEPWLVLSGSSKESRDAHIAEVFPDWELSSIARRTDTDDVACWDGRQIVVIDDYDVIRGDDGSATRMVSASFPSLEAWLLEAVQDFIEFD